MSPRLKSTCTSASLRTSSPKASTPAARSRKVAASSLNVVVAESSFTQPSSAPSTTERIRPRTATAAGPSASMPCRIPGSTSGACGRQGARSGWVPGKMRDATT